MICTSAVERPSKLCASSRGHSTMNLGGSGSARTETGAAGTKNSRRTSATAMPIAETVNSNEATRSKRVAVDRVMARADYRFSGAAARPSWGATDTGLTCRRFSRESRIQRREMASFRYVTAPDSSSQRLRRLPCHSRSRHLQKCRLPRYPNPHTRRGRLSKGESTGRFPLRRRSSRRRACSRVPSVDLRALSLP